MSDILPVDRLCIVRKLLPREFLFWRCLPISAKEQGNLINEDITSREVRLIGADGEQLGIMATQKALQIAYDKGLDLVMM